MEQMKTQPQRKLSKAQLYGKLIQRHYGELLFGYFHLPGFWESIALCVCVSSYLVCYMLHASHTKRHLIKEYCKMTPLKYEQRVNKLPISMMWQENLIMWRTSTQTSDNRKQFNVKYIHHKEKQWKPFCVASFATRQNKVSPWHGRTLFIKINSHWQKYSKCIMNSYMEQWEIQFTATLACGLK